MKQDDPEEKSWKGLLLMMGSKQATKEQEQATKEVVDWVRSIPHCVEHKLEEYILPSLSRFFFVFVKQEVGKWEVEMAMGLLLLRLLEQYVYWDGHFMR